MRARPGALRRLALAGVLVASNWLVYIWAVNHGHVVEAALGYYINPLITVAVGVVVLREQLRRLQAAALGFGLLAVVVLTAVPLLLFGTAATRIPLSTLGLLQYLTPTLQLLCGVLILGEPLPPNA